MASLGTPFLRGLDEAVIFLLLIWENLSAIKLMSGAHVCIQDFIGKDINGHRVEGFIYIHCNQKSA